MSFITSCTRILNVWLTIELLVVLHGADAHMGGQQQKPAPEYRASWWRASVRSCLFVSTAAS